MSVWDMVKDSNGKVSQCRVGSMIGLIVFLIDVQYLLFTDRALFASHLWEIGLVIMMLTGGRKIAEGIFERMKK